MSEPSSPALFKRGCTRLDGETDRRPADAPLADAGALDDPGVGGVEPGLEVGVREDLVGQRGAPSGYCGTHQLKASKSSAVTRSQATGWPCTTRSPDRTSTPSSSAGEGRADLGLAGPADEVADGDVSFEGLDLVSAGGELRRRAGEGVDRAEAARWRARR